MKIFGESTNLTCEYAKNFTFYQFQRLTWEREKFYKMFIASSAHEEKKRRRQPHHRALVAVYSYTMNNRLRLSETSRSKFVKSNNTRPRSNLTFPRSSSSCHYLHVMKRQISLVGSSQSATTQLQLARLSLTLNKNDDDDEDTERQYIACDNRREYRDIMSWNIFHFFMLVSLLWSLLASLYTWVKLKNFFSLPSSTSWQRKRMPNES